MTHDVGEHTVDQADAEYGQHEQHEHPQHEHGQGEQPQRHDEPARPVLRLDPQVAVRAYEHLRSGLDTLPATDRVDVHYAVKCQPHPGLCAALAAAGGKFEVASATEVNLLTALGVDAARLVFAHPAKPRRDIAAAYAAGVRLYALDSHGEVIKLAEEAPGADVMVRLATQPDSQVASEGKFGVEPVTAFALMLAAAKAGLRPVGVAFHVGSQCLDPHAWVQPIADAAQVMRRLAAHDITVRVLDIGGGFPARYAGPPPPPIETYAHVIGDAMEALLPYRVERVIAEPGRAVAAPAGQMLTRVDLVARRRGKLWAHLTVGAFHGLMEALESQQTIPWPASDRPAPGKKRRKNTTCTYTLTGPSCDSLDGIGTAELSTELDEGDQVIIGATGAYTTAYSNGHFNGYAVPDLVTINSADGDTHENHTDRTDDNPDDSDSARTAPTGLTGTAA